jgi:hypothetical protein
MILSMILRPFVVAKKRNPMPFFVNFMTWAAERRNFWGLARAD